MAPAAAAVFLDQSSPTAADFETEVCYLKDPQRVCSDEVVPDESLKAPRKVQVHDMRPALASYDLDVHGFQLLNLPYKERKDTDLDEIKSAYFEEITELLKKELGVRHVYCFAPVLRPLDYAEKPVPNKGKTIPRPHLDFGPNSAQKWWEWFTDPGLQNGVPAWLDSIGVDISDPATGPRYSILGLWRPLYQPVEKDPLCVSDFRSIPEEDYVILQPGKRKTYDGEWSVLKHGDPAQGVRHQWYYVANQRLDELLVFKHHDSAQEGVAWRCGHGAFAIPGTEDLPDRHSLEIRAFCIY